MYFYIYNYCIYIYIYVCMYILVYTHAYIHVYVCIWTYTYTHTICTYHGISACRQVTLVLTGRKASGTREFKTYRSEIVLSNVSPTEGEQLSTPLIKFRRAQVFHWNICENMSTHIISTHAQSQSEFDAHFSTAQCVALQSNQIHKAARQNLRWIEEHKHLLDRRHHGWSILIFGRIPVVRMHTRTYEHTHTSSQ